VETRELRAAQRQRFERLYAEHFDRVAAYLLARVDREVAGDALTATFEVAWRRIDDVPGDELPWLLGVARRVLANARRSRTRQAALVERMTAASQTQTNETETGLAANLAAALLQLTPPQREALLLIAWEGLSEREAARVLGCSRLAFAARLHRARAHIRAALGESSREARDTRASRLRSESSVEEAT
jgi:RNA polymerase sigma-70 factor, ECF subfamily